MILPTATTYQLRVSYSGYRISYNIYTFESQINVNRCYNIKYNNYITT